MLKYKSKKQSKREKMKKITAVLTAFVFTFVNANLSYANYDGYKAYVKGILALKDGNADLAVSEYEKVIAYDKSAVPVYKDMANIYWQMGKTQKALETAKATVDFTKPNSGILFVIPVLELIGLADPLGGLEK